MMFDEELNKDEIEDLSIANFLAITNKAYNLYLNQEIKDLDITTEQIPFIIELDKKENISKKELAKYLFLNDRNTARGLMELYLSGIIDRKPLDNEVSQENKINNDNNEGNHDKNSENSLNNENNRIHGTHGTHGAHENNGTYENNENHWFYRDHDFKQDLKISLTPYGKELASKIKEIDAKWEEIIYKNLEDSNKDEIMKSVKDLAISSLKTNKDANISSSEFKLSRAKQMLGKMLNRMFSYKYDNSTSNFDHRSEFRDEHLNNLRSEYIANHMEDFRPRSRNYCSADFRFGCDDYSKDDFRHAHRFGHRHHFRCNEMQECRFDDIGRCDMNRRDHEDLKRFKERIPNDNAFRYMGFFKARRVGNKWPFFR